MVKIWGLDLKEMQWGKFKSSYMWNNTYHMRRTKFIVYQLAMIFCVISESLGTAALSDYVNQQDFVSRMDPRATIHNNNFVGAFSYNIFVGVYVATIFGSAFFFDLFWPERREVPGVKLAWRICSILAIAFTLSSALLITIILATQSAFITGVNAQRATQLLEVSLPNEPLVYKHNKRGIASVVFIWPGLIATIASTILLWHSLAHIDRYGPFSTHARQTGNDDATNAEKPIHPVESSASGSALFQSIPYDRTSMPDEPQKAHQKNEPYGETEQQ